MKKSKLTILLVLILNIFGTALSGQTTFTKEQENFLAKQVIENKGYRYQDSLLKANLSDCEEQVQIKSKEVSGLNFANQQEKQIADNYRLNYTVLQNKYDRKIKILKFVKKAAAVLTAFVVIETYVIYRLLKP